MQIAIVLTSFVAVFAGVASAQAAQGVRQYITYGAMRQNTALCSKRGTSYQNCYAGQGGPANVWNRGCSRITRCARQVQAGEQTLPDTRPDVEPEA
ncbi:hypothetical protein FZEAL_5095 [Fusarium zealandicum]|uniref:Rapid alkalinization factor n=1 Tax=Fusarium zealandicum TaxID=1053134 RepID=A0A8H4XKY8_9HYPO|nr:hypothetical protein FZEAL_5095 [Fusarium zealandicum]